MPGQPVAQSHVDTRVFLGIWRSERCDDFVDFMASADMNARGGGVIQTKTKDMPSLRSLATKPNQPDDFAILGWFKGSPNDGDRASEIVVLVFE